jgi:hypothetical protein
MNTPAQGWRIWKILHDALSTDRVPKEQRKKIDYFVTPEAPP